MKSIAAVLALAACHGSSKPAPATGGVAIVGHGIQLTLAPSTSAAQLPNGTLIFGPRADKPLPAKLKNALVKPGKPPTALAPRAMGPLTVYSDGGSDTTAVALGDGMSTYEGVLTSVAVSPKDGDWTIVVDGKDQPWKPGQRVDVSEDGRSMQLAP